MSPPIERTRCDVGIPTPIGRRSSTGLKFCNADGLDPPSGLVLHEPGERRPVGWRLGGCSEYFMVEKSEEHQIDAPHCQSASPPERAGARPALVALGPGRIGVLSERLRQATCRRPDSEFQADALVRRISCHLSPRGSRPRSLASTPCRNHVIHHSPAAPARGNSCKCALYTPVGTSKLRTPTLGRRWLAPSSKAPTVTRRNGSARRPVFPQTVAPQTRFFCVVATRAGQLVVRFPRRHAGHAARCT